MTAKQAQLPSQASFVAKELVEITAHKFNLELDLKYATADNITSKPIYRQPICYLRAEAIKPLQTAVRLADEIGLRLKIFDAYRPAEAQLSLWNACPDADYIIPPWIGSSHTRAIAVDLTLSRIEGDTLDMGTAFDAMLEASHHGSTDVSVAAQRNRFLLRGLMATAGFETLVTEWWHYQLPGNWPLVNQELLASCIEVNV